MPDRLVEIYQRLTDKVEEIDVLVKEARRDDERELLASGGEDRRRSSARLSAQWDEVAALADRQKSILDEIVKQADEVASLSSFLQTHYEREKASLARELHDQLGGI